MLDITRLSLCHGVGTAHTPQPGLCWHPRPPVSLEKRAPAWHGAVLLPDASASSSAKISVFSWSHGSHLSIHQTQTPPAQAMKAHPRGSWSCQLQPRAARGSRRGARGRGRAGATPPARTGARSPRWSTRWCPCHPSGIPTGTHSSGWRPRT